MTNERAGARAHALAAWAVQVCRPGMPTGRTSSGCVRTETSPRSVCIVSPPEPLSARHLASRPYNSPGPGAQRPTSALVTRDLAGRRLRSDTSVLPPQDQQLGRGGALRRAGGDGVGRLLAQQSPGALVEHPPFQAQHLLQPRPVAIADQGGRGGQPPLLDAPAV